MPKPSSTPSLYPNDTFVHRHIGPSSSEIESMLSKLELESLSTLIEQTIPADIRLKQPLQLGYYDKSRAIGEHELLESLRQIAGQNRVYRSLIGMGYHGCIVPSVIQRNVLENPGWYTQYTPYQSEISQGRLEALLNFQTMIAELTALPIANASLLDEATAAAEAMQMCVAAARKKRMCFFVSEDCHPQTIAVVRTRAEAISVTIEVGDVRLIDLSQTKYCGVLVQYPTSYGAIEDYQGLCEAAHGSQTLVVVAADLLALAILRPPGEFGADICVGSAQRFGVPLGYGGPHAAFLSAKEVFKREIPGRIVGVSRDRRGQVAYRMALQTREQHIRREKASSNICTAQVLLAIMASMYAAYHGPKGIVAIAERVHGLTEVLALGLSRLGYELSEAPRFDTLLVGLAKTESGKTSGASIISAAESRGYNLRVIDEHRLGITLDECSTLEEVEILLDIFRQDGKKHESAEQLAKSLNIELPETFRRTTPALSHPVFSKYHAEHEMLRYLHRLQSKDLSLTTSMIPLGSCTMKLNATSEMVPLSWPEFANIHPFAPSNQAEGYAAMMTGLERWLCDITGFAGVSLQPNAGSQGEFTGLLTIRAYHRSRGDVQRDICLIPVSAHGTNPASAVLAGMKVVAVSCDQRGNIDVADLREKVAKHGEQVAAIMVTYPSTHGVFESSIREICEVVHQCGGQVYLDGANMNAQVGLCRPGDFGADVCHLNLHKTFCIPHGGGGPGMGPIGVAKHLVPFLPGHPVVASGGEQATGAVAAAPYGSASILTISWMYIALMGGEGLTEATRIAILNANYMAKCLSEHYSILYAGPNGRVAHEFIVDLRPYKSSAGIEAEDVAKRLMDYGFHSPTMSFPVAGTLMIEPTESESKEELDRFCEAMILIRQEIAAVESGQLDRKDNPLKNAPHIAAECTGTEWNHGYSREQAAYPASWLRDHKYWPTVARVDNVWGDRNLTCLCPPVSAYADSTSS